MARNLYYCTFLQRKKVQHCLSLISLICYSLRWPISQFFIINFFLLHVHTFSCTLDEHFQVLSFFSFPQISNFCLLIFRHHQNSSKNSRQLQEKTSWGCASYQLEELVRQALNQLPTSSSAQEKVKKTRSTLVFDCYKRPITIIITISYLSSPCEEMIRSLSCKKRGLLSTLKTNFG